MLYITEEIINYLPIKKKFLVAKKTSNFWETDSNKKEFQKTDQVGSV